jgi:predicted MFS family arabinose efflux permease
MNTPSSTIERPVTGLPLPVLLLMALASGLCAGSNYFNQPLLHSIAVGLNISESRAAFSVTLAQVSYAIGLLLLVPLGDKLERRSLVVGLMLLAAIGQVISGFSLDFTSLALGTVLAGLFSVAAQVLVPMAATLAAPGQNGKAVGIVMSGLLTGILSARSIAGLLSGLGGWNTVYRVAAVLMVLVSAALWFSLPQSRNPQQVSYLQILRSMATLLAQQPRLRSRALLGALTFASVSALFSTMALMLAGPQHGLSDTAIGLVGLVGVAGALMANVAGRLADQGRAQTTSAVAAALLLLSWVSLWQGGHSLGWFLLGMLVIDLALQGIHISNQNVVYALVPQARSRLNAVYMTSYFIGAASGSAMGTLAWNHGGWDSTCALGMCMAICSCLALGYDQMLVNRSR